MIIWVQILLFNKNTKYWPLINTPSNDSCNINRPDQYADISMFKVVIITNLEQKQKSA